MNHKYECMYILKPMDDNIIQEYISKFNDLIKDNGGDVQKCDIWGKKRLAYEIRDLFEGVYILITFTGEPNTCKELDRVMLITEDVLRHMIIRKGE